MLNSPIQNIESHQSPEYRMQIIASETDIDELGHVSNIAYVRWIQEVAKVHSASIGYDHPTYQRIGGVFVVYKYVIEYLTPAYIGEKISLVTQIASWRGASCERRTRIIRESDAQLLVRATTFWAFVSTQNGRPRRIPKEIIKAFKLEPNPC